jgi:hypothetical protein
MHLQDKRREAISNPISFLSLEIEPWGIIQKLQKRERLT